jgi:hypothetical protein
MADTPLSLDPNAGPQLLNQALAPQPTVAEVPAASQPARYSVPLLQNKTNEVADVPQDDLDVAIRSGEYSPRNDAEFIVLDKNGNRNVVQGKYLQQALHEGLVLENSQERHEREIQEKYGNSEIAAGVEGLARGAASIPAAISQGVSAVTGNEDLAFTPDQLMTELGQATGSNWTQQELADRAEANPVSSEIGNIAGQIMGFEGSIAKQGIGALEKQISKTVLKDAAKAGIGKRIAAALAAKTTAGAAEGAYFGAGQLMTEDSIGKADFNAENLIGYMGMNAILGGAISGGIEAVAQTAKAVAPFVKSAMAPLSRKISNNLDEKVSAGRLFGLTPLQLGKLEKRSPKVVADMQSYLKDDLKLGLSDSAEDLAVKNKLVKEQAGGEISSVLSEIDDTLKAAPELKPTSAEVWGNMWDKTYGKFQDFLSTASPGTSSEKKQIAKFLNEVEELRKGGGEFGAKDLQKIKRIQDDLMSYNKEPGKWTLKEDLVYLTRTAMRDEIDSLAQKLETNGLSTDLASKLKSANRRYSASATFGDYIEGRAAKAADKDFSLMNSVRDVGLDISRKLTVLGRLEKSKVAMQNLSKESLENFLKPVANKVRKAVVPFSIMNSEFAKSFDNGKYKKPKTEAEAYSNLENNMNRYGQNPDAFTQRVNRGSSSIYSSAPNTASALDVSAVQAALFLNSKLPKKSANPGPVELLKKPKPPSKFALSKMERYLNAVENPKSVFHDLERGRLSSEGAESLKIVYPNLFAQLQSQALEMLGSKPVPYNKRLQLGLLLGIPTDESLLPENVMGLQQNFQQQPEQASNQSAVNSTVSGMQSLGLDGRMQTDTQDSELG